MPESHEDDAASTAFDAALRALSWPDPDPGLRERCLPAELRSPQDRRCRVLVADDEPAIRQLICLHLKRAGYELFEARDGTEALALVRDRRPDLVILDVMMPGPDGFHVLRMLRSNPGTAAIPVLMLTARGGDDHVRQGWQSGTDFYMSKPFNPAELRAVVDRLAAVAGTPENPAPLRRSPK